MNIRKSYIILFLIVLVACSDKNGSNYQDATIIEYKDFASIQKLVGKVFLSDKEVLKPMRVYVCDTILVTMNPMEKKLFHLFDLNSKRKIGQRISLGQGPNEMIRPSIIKFDENQIIIFDVASFTLFTYDTADFISKEITLPVERRTLELQAYGEIGMLADCLIGSTYNPKNQFVKFNNAGNKVGEFVYYPVVTDLSYTDDEKLEAFKFSFVTNMKDRIAVCYKWTDLIDIYDQNGQLRKRIHGPEHSYARFKEFHNGDAIAATPDKENKDSYFFPYNVGDDFFVLFNGKPWNPDAKEMELPDRIFVFGWDGSPQKIYSLNQGIINFAVDKLHKKIYGISSSPEFHIVEFSF